MKQGPIIGITVSVDHGKIIRKGHDYLYVKRAYSEAVKKAASTLKRAQESSAYAQPDLKGLAYTPSAKPDESGCSSSTIIQ
jgi:hypothetical protein